MKKQTPRSPEEVLQILELFKCWQKPAEFIPLLNEINKLIVPPGEKPISGGGSTPVGGFFPILIEIGTYTGGTAAAFSEYCEAVYSIDQNRQLVGASNILYITGNSHEPATRKELVDIMKITTGFPGANRTVKKGHPDSDLRLADILFIDGDHSAEGTAQDFNDYKSLVRPGGLVAFHDIVDTPEHRSQGCFVAEFWNQLKTQYEHVEYITEPIHWGGIGIIKLPS